MTSFLKKVKRRIKHRYREGLSYISYFIKPTPSGPVRLVIFGQGRTGSTLLESLLCSTGYFRPNGELFNISRGEILYPLQYVRGLSKLTANENLIFHVKVYQLTRDRKRPIDPAKFLNALYGDGWKIIYLRRRNKVSHALSNVVAEHRGHYHKDSDDREAVKVFVNCEEFAEKVEERFHFENVEKAALTDVKYHEVVYENDLEISHNHQETVNRILGYISLENRKAFSKYRRVNAQLPKELISNYDEFVGMLKKQGWLRFLES